MVKNGMWNLFKQFLSKSNLTPNAKNNHLTKMNGKTVLKNGTWNNILVNGTAVLGSIKDTTNFTGIVVVNGNAELINTSFEHLEINGNANFENVEVKNILHVHGNVTLKMCKINS
jgi:hypothetical protein